MSPGRELDALVAEHAMGLSPVEWSDGFLVYGSQHTGGVVPKYSTDMRAAWLVVENIRKRSEFALEYDGIQWRARFTTWERALTAPHAICLAALLAVEERPRP